MANPGSFIRSAARATSSAYKRLPIRWRLAGGSAALTLVILCGFATIVGVLTTRRIQSDFNQQVAEAADELAKQSDLRVVERPNGQLDLRYRGPNLEAYAAAQSAVVRVITEDNELIKSSRDAPKLAPPLAPTIEFNGYRVESRPVRVHPIGGVGFVQYARRLSDVRATANRVKVFLGLGVLGGTALALLAGLATARRAMSPITELTEAARTIERTRDPSRRIPHPEAEDEVAELARTLDGMLHALDDARTETEATLSRQREFVADASHELRTPLTSVLANLELLEEVLDGEQREAAASALRSSRRMRRLVADLLLLARADAGRIAPHQDIDLSRVVAEAAGELEPVAGDHQITVSAPPGATVSGARDELHRLAVNLMENALRHTDPGTAVEASVERANGQVVLSVSDDGPGIPIENREKVFERFFRGDGDRSGSSGLGLAIVRAVAESHAGSVSLEDSPDGRGATFVVRLPAEKPYAAPTHRISV
ncbi:MAG TPA: HAMP domain-containing sensor histidine kinase [Solirubrobacteraceae bacterium]|nr:HAMP domain-containing sensor histidine kinase [Solirubrobacteraceae bacterium]